MDGFQTYALVNLLMLEKGETLESERVIAVCGPAIMANVHYLVDFVKETGRELLNLATSHKPLSNAPPPRDPKENKP